jgi:small subunit ribosomal protein S24e
VRALWHCRPIADARHVTCARHRRRHRRDRLIRQGLAKKVERSRKQLKEKKNRLKKLRGTKKAKN